MNGSQCRNPPAPREGEVLEVRPLSIATASHQMVSVSTATGTPDGATHTLLTLVPRRMAPLDQGTLRTLCYRPAPRTLGQGLGSTVIGRLHPHGVVALTPADLGLDHLVVEREGLRFLLRSHDSFAEHTTMP